MIASGHRAHWRAIETCAAVLRESGACAGAFVGVAVLLLSRPRAYLYYDYSPRCRRRAFFDDPVKQFKYGSTGGDRLAGIPAGIFKALPQLCRDYLPGEGWQSLGFVFEPGMDRPVGTSKRRSWGSTASR